MDVLEIEGGVPLKGNVSVPGAKNAATKLLVASLISDKKCTFTNMPNIAEVEATVELCEELGMVIEWDRANGVLVAQTKELSSVYIHQRFSGANRIPILAIGALLGRTTQDIIVPTAGGCNIGKRPVDFHINSLEKLGADIEYRKMKREGAYFAHAHNGLKGAVIHLNYPSVGATENTILAACRAKGKTVIHNAAVEPEIIDLILFLQKIGVIIHVDTDRTIHIHETKTFREATHRVIPDRLQAASFGMAAIATKGRVFVEGAMQQDMVAFLNMLLRIGGGFDVHESGIEFFYDKPLSGNVVLETDVFPGFATDWQQPFVVLLSQTEGCSIVHETVYENRFGYAETLKDMGADVALYTECLSGKQCRFASQNFPHSLVVKGPTPLSGGNIKIPDLRAGFAYVLAALIAPDKSALTGTHFLDRGYDHIDEKLAALGANIKRTRIVDKVAITV
ncbi:MAG: UDP-N-acetylglucosamine 1-carboxyvinyltransferase [Simkaniaceae bacterium]|nr:UDP-N-acetylglucosamine 1-carboxyvinyltransferase [Simkaniaceae bacterium]